MVLVDVVQRRAPRRHIPGQNAQTFHYRRANPPSGTRARSIPLLVPQSLLVSPIQRDPIPRVDSLD